VVLIWQRILPQIDRFQTPQQIAIEYLRSSGSEGSQGDPVVAGMFRPSMVFYSRRTLNFCPDDASLEQSLSAQEPPSSVVIHQASPEAHRSLQEHGYQIFDRLDSFPKKGSTEVYRK